MDSSDTKPDRVKRFHSSGLHPYRQRIARSNSRCFRLLEADNPASFAALLPFLLNLTASLLQYLQNFLEADFLPPEGNGQGGFRRDEAESLADGRADFLAPVLLALRTLHEFLRLLCGQLSL